MPVELVPVRVKKGEEEKVRLLDTLLSVSAPARAARLIAPSGEGLDLPEPVFDALRRAVHMLAEGNAVAIVPYGKMLTTQEAADFLNVSRPYLIKLLSEHQIPYELVGTHRRIRFEDLLQYRTVRDRQRREGLRNVTQLSQELGLYDNE